MTVRYWWTDDGEAEICERREVILEEDAECYHCSEKLEKGQRVCLLTNLKDNERYYLSTRCAEKSTSII